MAMLLALILLAALVLLPFFHCSTASPPPLNGSSAGFSLRLVANGNHRPEYDGFASLQRVKEQVRCRITHRLLPPGTVNITGAIRPFVCPPEDLTYAVMVGIGTERGYQNYELALDMATGLTWMQCMPCHPCLPQLTPVFDPTKSPTFHHVRPADRLCHDPHQGHDDKCNFSIRYRNGASAGGYLARDTFSFPSSDSSVEHLHAIAFGCAHQTAHFHTHGALAGVLGLGKGRPLTAFMKQVYHGNGRFSYCPFVPGMSSHSFLRFGDDIPVQPPAGEHRQRMMFFDLPPTSEAYYVRLAGVSVANLRLPGVTPQMFERGARGEGGCVIDVGTKLTAFVRAAYDHVEHAVRHHLQRHGARFVQQPGHHLCVHRTAAVQAHLPGMTLHFVGGTWLRVKPEHLFMVVESGGSEYLCLGVVPDAHMTVIGAMQQINTRFVFDLSNSIVSFNPEDCHLDV